MENNKQLAINAAKETARLMDEQRKAMLEIDIIERQLNGILESNKLSMPLKKALTLILKPERTLEDLKKAAWYLNREIIKLENV